jgi:hypothetical protein
MAEVLERGTCRDCGEELTRPYHRGEAVDGWFHVSLAAVATCPGEGPVTSMEPVPWAYETYPCEDPPEYEPPEDDSAAWVADAFADAAEDYQREMA